MEQLLHLRLELRDGSWSGTVPIRIGSAVVVTLQGTGGRSGWKELGRFTAAANQQVEVGLEGAEPTIETQVLTPTMDSPASGTLPQSPAP